MKCKFERFWLIIEIVVEFELVCGVGLEYSKSKKEFGIRF